MQGSEILLSLIIHFGGVQQLCGNSIENHSFCQGNRFLIPLHSPSLLPSVSAIIFSIFNTSTLRVDDANNFPFPFPEQQQEKPSGGQVENSAGSGVEMQGNSAQIIMPFPLPLPEFTHDCTAERLYFISCCILLLPLQPTLLLVSGEVTGALIGLYIILRIRGGLWGTWVMSPCHLICCQLVMLIDFLGL